MFRLNWYSWIVLLFMFLAVQNDCFAQDKKTASAKCGLGLEIGHWRPDDLSGEVALTPLKKVKKYPFYSLTFMKPWRWGMTFRSSLGYWKYSNDEPEPENMTIAIGSILLDLKYALLAEVRLVPYVSYGIGWFFGKATRSNQSLFGSDEDFELGIGINVGTGFDFNITRKFNLAMEFRYHYVKFKRVVVFTDNYSGPKISLGANYLF